MIVSIPSHDGHRSRGRALYFNGFTVFPNLLNSLKVDFTSDRKLASCDAGENLASSIEVDLVSSFGDVSTTTINNNGKWVTPADFNTHVSAIFSTSHLALEGDDFRLTVLQPHVHSFISSKDIRIRLNG
jgi:hypothetical protein